ncbi:transcriptional regulator [Actinacidiphila yanglinensis]|uniref:Transcriptional regulator n=1 Tax=Actinacidiphila yanglinensis TaxID=310779 RepID=A0A1H6BQU2_9ACTN|nr:LysR family transcriptional regulator [Actinacidiphila yanglinensis]SEG63063.1 transcriptional regulator [Actinacidiphila yanglinensis]
MIEARHLRVLRAVARTGSFSAAARELGCTQPAVSQQMKALEGSAGTPLLVRGAREMRLTEAGEVLVRHAAGILSGLTAAEEEVAAIAGLRAGRVRLASFPSGSSTLVPSAVADLRAHHPDTRVSLVEAEPPRSVEMLRAGDCDITLAFRYVDLPTPAEESWSDLVVRPLLTDRLVGLVPADHPLAAGSGGAGSEGAGSKGEGSEGGRASVPSVPYDALAAEQWIAGCPRCRRHLVEVCERAGFTPRIDFATDDYPAVVGLVAAGLGVAVLPELALAAVRTDGVAVLEMAPSVEREVVALTLPDLAHVPAVDMMLARLTRAGLRARTPRD